MFWFWRLAPLAVVVSVLAYLLSDGNYLVTPFIIGFCVLVGKIAAHLDNRRDRQKDKLFDSRD